MAQSTQSPAAGHFAYASRAPGASGANAESSGGTTKSDAAIVDGLPWDVIDAATAFCAGDSDKRSMVAGVRDLTHSLVLTQLNSQHGCLEGKNPNLKEKKQQEGKTEN